MSVSEIQLYQILKAKIGDKEAEELVSCVKSEVNKEFETKKDTLAIKVDLANMKSEIIKWMFILWIGQITITLGIIFAFINK
ncbi:hypothetical protein [Pedobacter glucosidilyticus]|uniref:hypothetical protein n=1 Tax=Pedobacter glucosidilyticus TaxID=1122941 RepID=UPI0026EE66DC|nr:hypothetical protein [Pedobacter glucosidilyticus]